jgi:hypothetical protein
VFEEIFVERGKVLTGSNVQGFSYGLRVRVGIHGCTQGSRRVIRVWHTQL